jgi:hypothetical protein
MGRLYHLSPEREGRRRMMTDMMTKTAWVGQTAKRVFARRGELGEIKSWRKLRVEAEKVDRKIGPQV